MKETDPSHRPPGHDLNELDKMFFWGEPLGSRPMVRILFEFEGGHVDMQRLRQAYLLEIQRRPVLNSTIADSPAGPGWNVRWMPRDSADETCAVRLCDLTGLSVADADARVREIQFDPFTGFSSRTSPPFSMVLCDLPAGRQKLLGFITHCVTDAHGIGLIFEELFTIYNNISAGLAPETSLCPDPGRQPSPLLPKSRGRRFVRFLGALGVLARNAVTTRFQAPVKIFTGRNILSDPIDAVHRVLPQERLAGYLAAAKRLGASLGDLMVAAQILAIERYKKSCGEAPGVISVDVHQNLRRTESEMLELGNKFSTFIVATLPRHRTSPAGLVQHVHRELEQALRRGTAEKLICLLWPLNTRIAAKTLPLWENSVFNNPKVGESSQVTNMGRLWAGPRNTTRLTRLGDAQIAVCLMAALPSPAIGNFCGFLTYNNRFLIRFIYFIRTMTEARARQFLGLLVQALDDYAAGA